MKSKSLKKISQKRIEKPTLKEIRTGCNVMDNEGGGHYIGLAKNKKNN